MRHLVGIAWHVGGSVLAPFVLAVIAALFLEVSQVAETSGMLLALAGGVLLPVCLAQNLGLWLKVRRELAMLRQRGPVDTTTLLATIHRHAAIVTPRGWAMLFAGCGFLVAALAFKWADLSLVGVVALVAFYALVGASSLLSALVTGRFEAHLQSRRGAVTRVMTPAVVLQGEPAEERFTLDRVPVLPGWNLLIEDRMPQRLATISRYAVGPGAGKGEVSVGGRLRATPRGLYRVGPANIYYQDLFGVARVSVASVARADLKVLPRFKPLRIVEPPRTREEQPDIVTRIHRFPTEDHFRFRAYVNGDDTRRIHWRLSVKTGELQVRTPETREVSTRTVLLVIDSFLPQGRMLDDAVGVEEVLDRLVETTLALAKSLVERGDRVTLVAAARGDDGTLRIERLPAQKSARLRWQDLGARVVWQGRADIGALVAAGEGRGVAVLPLDAGAPIEGAITDAVVVSSRFQTPPPDFASAGKMTWVYLPPEEALAEPVPSIRDIWLGPRGTWAKLFRDPFPVGADENGWVHQLLDIRGQLGKRASRLRLKEVAEARGRATFAALVARGDTVYRLVPGGAGHQLVGVAP